MNLHFHVGEQNYEQFFLIDQTSIYHIASIRNYCEISYDILLKYVENIINVNYSFFSIENNHTLNKKQQNKVKDFLCYYFF